MKKFSWNTILLHQPPCLIVATAIQNLFRSEAPLQLTLSVRLSVVLSVCTPLALLYMAIVYIFHNDLLLLLENLSSPFVYTYMNISLKGPSILASTA